MKDDPRTEREFEEIDKFERLNARNHTPTPWETSVNGYMQFDVCEANGGNMIADLSECENQIANAAFIVRACNSHAELVAALVTARHALHAKGGPTAVERDMAIYDIDAALEHTRAE